MGGLKYAKAYAGLIGAVGTWAVTTFPASHVAQTLGGLACAVATGLGVAVVRNASKGKHHQ